MGFVELKIEKTTSKMKSTKSLFYLFIYFYADYSGWRWDQIAGE